MNSSPQGARQEINEVSKEKYILTGNYHHRIFLAICMC